MNRLNQMVKLSSVGVVVVSLGMAARRAKKRATSSKRLDIVLAATSFFRRQGFRKTSIDQIAEQAQVAKPTVYAYFADKDALFVAVCEAVIAEMFADVQRARDEGATIVKRLSGMLSAKFTKVFELIESSPHARELLESTRNAEAKKVVDAADAHFVDLLTQEIRSAAKRRDLDLSALGVSAAELVRILMQAAHGASFGASSPKEHRANVVRLTTMLLSARRA